MEIPQINNTTLKQQIMDKFLSSSKKEPSEKETKVSENGLSNVFTDFSNINSNNKNNTLVSTSSTSKNNTSNPNLYTNIQQLEFLQQLLEAKGLPSVTEYQIGKMQNLYIDRPEYIFYNKKYHYISNELLDRDFEVTLGKTEDVTSYEVRFCIFKVNGKCKDPFLQFFLEIMEKPNKESGTLTFPSFELKTSLFDGNDKDPKEIFEKECFHKYENLVKNKDEVSNKIIKESYRGYIEEINKENKHIIYAFFDSTYYGIKQTENQLWCILDEFINEKKVFGNCYTDENIYHLFTTNEHIVYVTDEYGENVNIPCCLYLCKLTEDENDYVNVYLDDVENNPNNKEVPESPYLIYHSVFGNNCLFFTTDPIEKDEVKKLKTIKRYATYIDKSLYVLNIHKDIDTINFDVDTDDDDDSLDGVPEEDIPKTHEKYSCIYFFENYKQLWCMKDNLRYTEICGGY
jgi:hypothetical protein